MTDKNIREYEEDLEALTVEADNNNPIIKDKNNKPSMIAMVAYSYKEDIDLDQWIVDYVNKHNTYIRNQKQNYMRMRKDLEEFMKRMEVSWERD